MRHFILGSVAGLIFVSVGCSTPHVLTTKGHPLEGIWKYRGVECSSGKTTSLGAELNERAKGTKEASVLRYTRGGKAILWGKAYASKPDSENFCENETLIEWPDQLIPGTCNSKSRGQRRGEIAMDVCRNSFVIDDLLCFATGYSIEASKLKFKISQNWENPSSDFPKYCETSNAFLIFERVL
ncbi:MAG TPA: hypothetical protein DCS07_00940 [Bdellovibrionales bacterium]|nr:MAG: hypothetical protein A2Z97_10850 [Bdellovibrionales bacterium GWB1_52_6]OFZ03542.1 MAG: hypothetical protein A2X97_06240 [Bdellovibrionales bacterium GWA1_52_35]OFZ38329.1 MAG: hypothetical protein A2070_15005 [Bdellovibrionales bacterium GWC1_52_8]HAR41193.1 hypothetical protein [Bdellovibrionales bacterium]HCM41128.1 hypothetical protein [Bdellovibrionales bacterium]